MRRQHTVKLNRDWAEFIELLISHRVRFLVVGAHALAAHGRPRYTGDLDVLVEPTKANAKRLERVFRAFAGDSLADEASRFSMPDKMVSIGAVPTRLDVMTSISGVLFAEAWKSRLPVRFGAQFIGVLGRAAFIKNKRAAGRPKDLLDIALLEETHPQS